MEQKQSVESVLAIHDDLCAKARALIAKKGHDYGRHDQAAGDTLGNLRLARRLGILDSDAKSVLVRLCDKFARLASLVDVEAQTTDESIEDTILDVINYSTYFYIFRVLEQREANKFRAAATKTIEKHRKPGPEYVRAPYPDGATDDEDDIYPPIEDVPPKHVTV